MYPGKLDTICIFFTLFINFPASYNVGFFVLYQVDRLFQGMDNKAVIAIYVVVTVSGDNNMYPIG
jgi:hypothetical protein